MRKFAANRRRSILASEDGSTILLTIAYCVLALMLIGVVTAATSLYLEHKRLHAVSDATALAGAEAVDLENAVVREGRVVAPLTNDSVRDAAERYLRVAGGSTADGLHEVRIERAASEDGATASVRLSSVWHPPFVTLFVPDGVRIETESRARTAFR